MNGEFCIKTRIRYSETDKMGVVHHASYFNYFEMARTEFMRSLGLPYRDLEKKGLFLVVTDAFCRYKSNASYDDQIKIMVSIAWVKKASLQFDYLVFNDTDDLLAKGYTIHACINTKGKPTRLPEEIIDVFSRVSEDKR